MCQEKAEEESLLLNNGTKDYKTINKLEHILYHRRQALAAFGVIMFAFASGACDGFSAILLPQLSVPDSSIRISLTSSSWIASINCLPIAIMNVFAGYSMGRFGRRKSLLWIALPYALSWIMLSFSESLATLLLARFINGIGQGLSDTIIPIFLGEISSVKTRAYLLPLLPFSMTLSTLITHALGSYMSWRYTAVFCTLYPFLALIALLFVPESFNWYILKQRNGDAFDAFTWYRGYSQIEINEYSNVIEAEILNNYREKTAISFWVKIKRLKSHLKRPEFYKPLILTIILFVVYNFAGTNVLIYYTSEIMNGLLTADSSIDKKTAMIATDAVRVLAGIVMCLLFKVVGRRPLGILSTFATSLFLIVLGIYTTLCKIGVLNVSNTITVILIMGFVASSYLGMAAIPWIMIGEVFPRDVRGLGASITIIVGAFSLFITVITAPSLFAVISIHGTLFLYGVLALLGCIYMYFYMPETKGKSLLEIEHGFK